MPGPRRQKGGSQKRNPQGKEEATGTAGEEGSSGLYGRHFDPQEKADLVDHALEDSLLDQLGPEWNLDL
jgi:hypothetical protein